MKLLLTSSGNTNASIEKALLNLIGKPFKDASLTFIPTAADAVTEDKTWLVNDMNNFRKLGFKNLYITDIAAVPKEVWYPNFEDSDILVFGGGDSAFLLERIHKSGLVNYMPEFIKTKVYVGISAGSMITAKNVSLSSSGILYYEDTGNFQNLKGFGFVDFEIRPHLNSVHFPKVRIDLLKKIEKDLTSPFYAIDDDTAIQVVDDKVNVISEGKWHKFDRL